MSNDGAKNTVLLDKILGETPLECLERYRAEQIRMGHDEFMDMPMTYAGRLDPLATGALLVLLGEECKNKEKYLGLDKEYEVGVLFGVKTDTGDMLGLIKKVDVSKPATFNPAKFSGKFEQEYPAYSSKTVNGVQLHNLARAGELPNEMPTKSVEIYSIKELGNDQISGVRLAVKAIEAVSKVQGDFRQQEIIDGWKMFAEKYSNVIFSLLKLRVNCSGGAYMRSLAEKIGKNAGTVGVAVSIHRTKIVDL